MTKIQFQLPDSLYSEVKRVARDLEWPLAEVLRRGAEYMVRCYPQRPTDHDAWKLPQGEDLGRIRIHYSRWRELVHESNALPGRH